MVGRLQAEGRLRLVQLLFLDIESVQSRLLLLRHKVFLFREHKLRHFVREEIAGRPGAARALQFALLLICFYACHCCLASG